MTKLQINLGRLFLLRRHLVSSSEKSYLKKTCFRFDLSNIVKWCHDVEEPLRTLCVYLTHVLIFWIGHLKRWPLSYRLLFNRCKLSVQIEMKVTLGMKEFKSNRSNSLVLLIAPSGNHNFRSAKMTVWMKLHILIQPPKRSKLVIRRNWSAVSVTSIISYREVWNFKRVIFSVV